VPERLRQRIFRGSDAVAEGLISASCLRREYLSVIHGMYVPAGTVIDHGIRTLAALLRMSAPAVLTAHSAAWWYGVTHAEPADPVMLILPRDLPVKGARGVRVHVTDLSHADIHIVDGLRLASPIRTARDAATLTSPRDALATVDGLLRRGLTTRDELRRMTEEMSGRWGVARVRTVFELADGLSESPAESWTRWLLHRASIPPPVLQFEVVDDHGRFVARVDFGWPDCRVALEYDGSYHADPLQQVKDRERDAALRSLGWTVIHMTAIDLRDPERVLQDLRRALKQ